MEWILWVLRLGVVGRWWSELWVGGWVKWGGWLECGGWLEVGWSAVVGKWLGGVGRLVEWIGWMEWGGWVECGRWVDWEVGWSGEVGWSA